MTDVGEKQISAGADSDNRAALSPTAMLVESALTLVADKGLDQFSMRVVAATIGRSTTSIIQGFGNKNGLLAAMVATAFDRDAQFHAHFLQNISGLILDRDALTETIAYYIESRVTCGDAAIRVWPELLFNGGRSPIWTPMLIRWRQMRENFWDTLLPDGLPNLLSLVLADYTVMEEVYAVVLQGGFDYRLQLRETVGRLVDGAICAKTIDNVDQVRTWLADTAPPAPPRSLESAGTSRSRLLAVAAAEILAHGATALNHRRLTAKAGVSTAMIIYHFGDMEQFTVEAIWHALLNGLPAYLDDSNPARPVRQTDEEWPNVLAKTLVSSGGGACASGFYIGYSRIVGQTCLRARHHPNLVTLVRYLRLIEGSGMHHASQTSWPPTLALDRGRATVIAIWIKGWAMTVESTGEDGLTPNRLGTIRRWVESNEHASPEN
jgi:AcrR family transcriptional regulator